MRPRYEYMRVLLVGGFSDGVERLNAFGFQGWRVVPGVTAGPSYVLMEREVLSDR